MFIKYFYKILRFFHLISKLKYQKRGVAYSKEYQTLKDSSLFDGDWYKKNNPDIKVKNIDPLEHYINYGWKEGRNPSSKFNSIRYLTLNPDVAEKNICPLFHYEVFGKKEGRLLWSGKSNSSADIKEYWKLNSKLKKHNKVHYTCMIGGYDKVIAYDYIDPDWDYVLFTDNEDLIKQEKYLHWRIKPLQYTKMDNVRNARWHKTHPHELFPDYEWSMWQDANSNIKNGFFYELAQKHMKNDKLFSLSIHPKRKCIYEEANVCIDSQRDNEDIIKEQIHKIKEDGFPENFGMFETFILLRKHKDETVVKLMNDWWWWIENYSRRDQLSLSYVLWKNNFKINLFAPKALRLYKDTVDIYQHAYTPSTNYKL